jgi:hypothetical protein
MSLASRSSAFSFLSRLISASSSLVGPLRCSAPAWACSTHLRSVSGPTPSFGPSAWATAHAEPYSPSRSQAILVARCRCSAGYLLGMVCILKEGSGIKPETVHSAVSSMWVDVNPPLERPAFAESKKVGQPWFDGTAAGQAQPGRHVMTPGTWMRGNYQSGVGWRATAEPRCGRIMCSSRWPPR